MSDYSVLDDLVEGIQIVGPDMRYVYLNNQLLREVGISRKAIVGLRMTEKFPGIDQTQIYEEIVRCLKDKKPSRIVNEFKFPDGKRTYYELSLQFISEGVLIFSRDITESRRGELLLEESNRNLEQFAHVAAHDMREPVRRIAGLTKELLLNFGPQLAEGGQWLCKRLQEQSDNLLQLINDFRSLSAIGAADDWVRQEVSMMDLVCSALEPHRQQFAELDMEVVLPTQDVKMDAYPSLVSILLRNLIQNALCHGENSLRVHFDTSDKLPVFTLSNSSSGRLPPKDIFLPFVSRNTRTSTGLGLTIAKQVVARHSGRIWAEQDDHWFSVHFTLASSNEDSGNLDQP